MKLGPVTKLDMRNMTTTKNLLATLNYDVIVFFLNHGQFATIWKPDSRHMQTFFQALFYYQ